MAGKEYKVVRDGEVLKTYKSLPAAKQLAEKEKAEVYAGDEKVYQPSSGETEEKSTAVFTLTALMNVREKPSLKAEILKTLPAGTKVEVETIRDDWLYLSDGTYIFYSGGKFASRD